MKQSGSGVRVRFFLADCSTKKKSSENMPNSGQSRRNILNYFGNVISNFCKKILSIMRLYTSISTIMYLHIQKIISIIPFRG